MGMSPPGEDEAGGLGAVHPRAEIDVHEYEVYGGIATGGFYGGFSSALAYNAIAETLEGPFLREG